ncbi:hypothetical protein [Streptomyces sp. NPDC048442]|uniref:hypothetical protein n=1 Tax=Streptomyces sp. NPDC048442 TaxID=3154823 RepID=UPI00342207C6
MSIDQLLEDAAVPVSRADKFDVGTALQRLAADPNRRRPAPKIERAARAGERLSIICKWVLHGPGVAHHLHRMVGALTQDAPATAASGDGMDLDGATGLACLLYLTGHPESADFWWGIAAGADHGVAAYCLHLHHLARGETREATHWREQIVRTAARNDEPVDERFLEWIDVLAHWVRANGYAVTGPTELLKREIARLAEDGSCVIIHNPDERLAERLRDFARR